MGEANGTCSAGAVDPSTLSRALESDDAAPTSSHSASRYAACQRASAARRAISRRRFGLSFSARALPPFNPPSRPSAIACGFFR